VRRALGDTMRAGLLGRTVRQDLGPLTWRPGAFGVAMGGGDAGAGGDAYFVEGLMVAARRRVRRLISSALRLFTSRR
jgi:hypothetical protein